MLLVWYQPEAVIGSDEEYAQYEFIASVLYGNVNVRSVDE